MESGVTKNLANMESQVTENLVNEERWFIQHSGKTEHRVRQDSDGYTEVRKDATLSRRMAPRWCPRGITKTQKRRLQKMHQRELAEKKKQQPPDYWFNRLQPMTRLKQTWREKWLAKEEGGSSGEEASMITLK
jgi:hypothetical protein